MNLLRRLIARHWDVGLSAACAVVGALMLTPTNLGHVTADLVVWYGVQAAAILPAMIFAASILRPDGLTITELRRYRAALRSQMGFWAAQLLLNFLAALSLIAGEAVDWKIAAPVHWLASSHEYAPGFIGVATFFGTLAVLRSVAFVNGVFSLLELNGELNEKAVIARTAAEAGKGVGAKKPSLIKTPDDYGKISPEQRH